MRKVEKVDMRYTNILFDLDGTITEPFEGISNGFIYALEKLNISVPDKDSLRKVVGPPLVDSFQEFYGMTLDEAKEATRLYREYYSERGVLENELMPGIKDTLKNLKDVGCHLYVATSKPTIYAEQILKNLGVDEYFSMIVGSLLDGSRDSKDKVISYLLEESGIGTSKEALSKTVMVGDRKFDILGAKAFNMDSVAVTFGYGDVEEFNQVGPTYIIDLAEELVEIVLG